MGTTLRNGILGLFALAGTLSPLACAGKEDVSLDESLGAEDSALRKRPEASRCFGDVIGDGKSCMADADIKEKVRNICRAKGAYVTNLDVHGECKPDGHTVAKYECCAIDKDPPPPPPPNPPRCMTTVFEAKVCHADADWKKRAHTWCELNSLVLSDVSYGGCIDGTKDASNRIKVECCTYIKPPPPPPPPPPPVKCTTDVVGDGSGCNANDLLKLKAAGTCEASGLVLRDIAYANDCPTSTNATGSSTYAKFQCCGRLDK